MKTAVLILLFSNKLKVKFIHHISPLALHMCNCIEVFLLLIIGYSVPPNLFFYEQRKQWIRGGSVV